MDHHQKHNFIGLIAWIALCFIAAALGGFASLDAGLFTDPLINLHEPHLLQFSAPCGQPCMP